MELVDIKNKLEEAVETENWNLVVEVLEQIEIEANYTSPYDDSEEEIWG
jgi:hypothetical protein